MVYTALLNYITVKFPIRQMFAHGIFSTMDEYIEQLLAEMPDEKSTLHDVIQNILDEPIPRTVKRRLLKPLYPEKYRPHVRLPRTGRPSWRSLILSLVKNPWSVGEYQDEILDLFTVPKDDKLVFRQTPWAIGSFLRGWQMVVPQGHPHGADPRAFLEGVRHQIHHKLEEEIKALNGIKFQQALKVQLRKDSPDGSEEYTDPVLRHKLEAILQKSEIKGGGGGGASIKLSPGSKKHWRSGRREGQAGL